MSLFFSYATHEMEGLGAPAPLVSWAKEASDEEQEHAGLCLAYARELDPDVREREPLVHELEPDAPAERVLGLLVATCVMSETLASAYLAEMRRRAQTEGAREIIRRLLDDEIRHGKLGWAYLAWALREHRLHDWLARGMPMILDRTLGSVLRSAVDLVPPFDVLEAERFGYLSADDGRLLYVETVRDAILPGLASLGVDTSRCELP